MTREEEAGADPCAREPIHIIGHIQAHGLLLAISEPDLVVRQTSANAHALCGRAPDDLLGRPLETLLGAPQTALLRDVLSGDLLAANPFRIELGEPARAFDCIAHRNDSMLVLEFEPQDGTAQAKPLNVAAHLKSPLSQMERAPDLVRLAGVAAREIRRLSGFDRVLIYRFGPDYDGEVVAEAAAPGAESYLNLRFPASDIPPQARRLFLANTLRLIADVDSQPVPLVPGVRPDTGRPLDMSHSALRSASPVHIEYLHNMNVRATLTISIVVQEKLWGMIACHHPEPLRLAYEVRSVCELVGRLLASQILARTDNDELQARLLAHDRIERYMSDIERSAGPVDGGHVVNEGLLELFDGDGMRARVGGAAVAYGTVVDETRFATVLQKLRSQATRGIASSSALFILDDAASAFRGDASGALYVGFSETSDDYVVIFRRELIETVRWAGDPHKAPANDAAQALRPRTSFAAWQETVRGHSRPWTDLELSGARLVREQFLRVREAHERHIAEERVRYLALNDSLTQLANRTAIADRLEGCIAQASADHSQLAVLFIDLDRFKHFNDTWGHATGDRILQIVAARMKHNVRGEDMVGRLGGDEFIVVMPGIATEAQSIEAAVRLLAEIEKPLRLDHGYAKITASIGISRFPSDANDLEGLLSHSDAAMYRAKQSGRNAATAY